MGTVARTLSIGIIYLLLCIRNISGTTWMKILPQRKPNLCLNLNFFITWDVDFLIFPSNKEYKLLLLMHYLNKKKTHTKQKRKKQNKNKKPKNGHNLILFKSIYTKYMSILTQQNMKNIPCYFTCVNHSGVHRFLMDVKN